MNCIKDSQDLEEARVKFIDQAVELLRVYYIKNEQKNKNQEYKDINIRERNQTEKINNLYKLSESEIRVISKYIYEQKKN